MKIVVSYTSANTVIQCLGIGFRICLIYSWKRIKRFNDWGGERGTGLKLSVPSKFLYFENFESSSKKKWIEFTIFVLKYSKMNAINFKVYPE